MSTQPNIPESNIVPIALNVSAPIAPSLGVTKEALRRHTDVFQDPKNARHFSRARLQKLPVGIFQLHLRRADIAY